MVKDHGLLKVWLGHVIEPAELSAVVDAEYQAAQDHLGEIRFSSERAQELDLGYAALVERCCERIAEARVEAFRELSNAISAASSVPAGASTKGNQG